MENLDTESSEETVTALADEESSEDLFGTLAKSGSTNQESSAYSSDLFVDTFNSSPTVDQYLSRKSEDIFFSLDDTADESTASVPAKQGGFLFTEEDVVKVDEVSASSSLFDDLLDFSSPRPSETGQFVLDSTADAKPVPTVDLLSGVDGALVSPPGFQPEVKANAPDILDFVMSCDFPEITSMGLTDSPTNESLTDDWDLLTEVTSPKPGLDRSPDIIVNDTTDDDNEDEVTLNELKESETDTKEDETDGAAGDKQFDSEKHVGSADDMEQITDGDIEVKTVEIHHNSSEPDQMKNSFQDIDFSVLELPGASNLNFDHYKHKRSISQKGSIANRKKPKRATIQPVGEDSIYMDSTEPKSEKPQNEDVTDSVLNLDNSKGDKAQETGGELSAETSPTRKLAGGIKIPGLLEGLSKSKAFARAEKTSPVAEPDSKPEIVNLTSAPDKEISPTTLSSVTSPEVTNSPPLIRPKPVVLPRVLPKPATKTLKESQNQATASGIAARASSFRNASSSPGTVDKPSLLASPVALSRSASVKVTPVAANKDVEISSIKEEKSASVPISKLVPLKPELTKPISPAALRLQNKTPPPVPVKPSVAAKPGRASLGWSASFSGGKSPLLPALKSETETEVAISKKQKSDSDVTVSAEKKTDSTNTTNTEKKKSDSDVTVNVEKKNYSTRTANTEKKKSDSDVTVNVEKKNYSTRTANTEKKKSDSDVTVNAEKKTDSTNTTNTEKKKSDSDVTVNAEKKTDSTNTTNTEKKYIPDNKSYSSSLNSERKPLSFVQKKTEGTHSLAASEKTDATVEIVKSAPGGPETSKNATMNRIPSVRASLPSGYVARSGFRVGENYANVEAKKADNFDADDVFDGTAEKTVSSVNNPDSSSTGEKFDSANNVDDILHRRKSSISGVNPVKSPSTGDKFPTGVMPRKGSITGSAYNPIGFRSTLGSSDSDQRSRTSSVSSSVEGTIVAQESANLLSAASPNPKPRTGSDASTEDHKSRNGSFITAAVEKVRSSPDKFLEVGPGKTTKSETLPETKLISSLLPNKGDEKKKELTETKNDSQKLSKPLRDSTSPGHLNGSPNASRGRLAADKTTSPWNVQLKKVEKKESPKLEPAVKTDDSQPVNWRQQLSVRQKSSVPPKITEKPKQDTTPEWAKASIKRRQRLIESGVIRGDT